MSVQDRVLKYLAAEGKPHSPTEIGMALGYSYYSASSAVQHALRRLIAQGKVQRTVPEAGRVVYGVKA